MPGRGGLGHREWRFDNGSTAAAPRRRRGPVGRIASDGKSLLPIGGAVLQQRRRLAGDGSVVATLVVDRPGWLAAPPRSA